MMKNLFILALFTWVGLTHAYVAKESLSDAEGYQLQKVESEPEAQRSVAGSKIKKQRLNRNDAPSNSVSPVPPAADSSAIVEESEGSEVRYWQYSE